MDVLRSVRCLPISDLFSVGERTASYQLLPDSFKYGGARGEVSRNLR